MSLINDALRNRSAKPAAARPDLPAAIPVMESARRETHGGLGWIVAAIVLVAAGGLFFLKRQPVTQPVQVQTATNKPFVNPLQTAANVLNKVADRNDQGNTVADTIATAPATVTTAPPVVTAPPKPAPALVTAPPPAPQAAALKLQAIYYRMSNPTAVLNGKTVRTGSNVAGAKVLAIHRTSVEVEIQGQKKTLVIN